MQIDTIERPFVRQRNRSRDFCFIIFETEEAAESAIASPKQVIGGKECDIKLAHPQRNQGNGPHSGPGGFGSGGMGGFGGGRGPRGPPGGGGGSFFKSGGGGGGGGGGGRNSNSMGGGNWRNSDRPSGGGFRGGPGGSGGHGGGHDDRGGGFPDTTFLTNVDTMPNNGYGGYKSYNNNSNFFPNYWN